MALAMNEAEAAAAAGEVPVGCVIVSQGQVIATGRNTRESEQDPTGHAELNALRAAAQARGSWRLDDCTVVVTLEPCAMCSGAMVLARVQGCVYGCSDPKGGFLGSLGNLANDPRLNHRFPVRSGVLGDACSEQLRQFFRALRQRKRS
ncbi:MAG: nucleoside deaminase [Planctomycetota bacterium]